MNFVKKDLAPGITVYRPEFKDLSKTLDIVKRSTDQHTILFNIDPENKMQYPDKTSIKGWKKKPGIDGNHQMMTEIDQSNFNYLRANGFSDHEEVQLIDEINTIYDVCFQDYTKTMKNTEIHLPYIKNYDPYSTEWNCRNSVSLHKHEARDPSYSLKLWENEKNQEILNQEILKGTAINLGWHFDEFKFENITSYRHAVTGNTYLNDDYESGRIMFLYGNDWNNFKNFDNLNIISYKPMAGDVILYPVFWPVAHSVTIPFIKDRYLISKIWSYRYHTNDFNSELMEYCKELCRSFADGEVSVKVLKEKTKLINGKDFWSNNIDSDK